MVAGLCAERGLRHRTLVVAVDSNGNIQANARAARYAALASWAGERGFGAIATAHHLDDQAETLLMRLVRGAGVRGLAGMRPRAALPGSEQATLLRPLLWWRRRELADIVAAAGLRPVLDPGNADMRFERAAWRRRLEDTSWLPPVKLAESARHLGEADEALAWAAQREFAERVAAAGDGWLYSPAAPRAVRLRVLERLVGRGQRPSRGPELARLLESLEQGRTATLAGTKAMVLSDGRWHFAPAPPHRRGE